MFTCDTSACDRTTLVTNVVNDGKIPPRFVNVRFFALSPYEKKQEHLIWDIIEQTIKFLLGGILTLTAQN